jgi:hypothetical protein
MVFIIYLIKEDYKICILKRLPLLFRKSKFISTILRETLISQRNRHIKDAYDQAFSDKSIRKEQLSCTRWFEGLGTEEGQEW